MFDQWRKKQEARKDAVNKARAQFTSWLDISQSIGWKVYLEKIEKKIEIIKNKMDNDTSLTGEDLKRLQLALQVWKEVQRVPKDLEDNAKSGGK